MHKWFFEKNQKLILVLYGIVSVVLFLYSYTQVDLNLTLSRVSIWQTIQKSFQYIGYFQRPLSTWIFLGILAALFSLYFVILRLVSKNHLSERALWNIILLVTVLLVFSYPAFSNDMFNYMFTAKTVLIYHQNPYILIPRQLIGIEPWIMFMRWIHLPSAYTPLWIFLTLPVYLLGFGYFLLIMWNVKILVALFYLVTIWGIGKSLSLVDKRNKVLGMAIFALNPLILIECLVSSHNDITMMAVAMVAYYLFLTKKAWSSWFMLSVSVALKTMTIFAAPLYFLKWNRFVALGLVLLGFGLVVSQREVQPWYWVWVMPFVALLPTRWDFVLVASGVSLGLLLRYAPFLYLGNWDAPAPTIKIWVTSVPIALSVLFYLFFRFVKRIKPA